METPQSGGMETPLSGGMNDPLASGRIEIPTEENPTEGDVIGGSQQLSDAEGTHSITENNDANDDVTASESNESTSEQPTHVDEPLKRLVSSS